jgi:uncharacterized protein (TIGR02099 family)
VSSAWQRRWRRFRFALLAVVSSALILLALMAALGQLLLPLAARFPDAIAATLSEKLHRPIRFGSLTGHWEASGPLLVARDVTLAGINGSESLTLPDVAIKIDFGAMFLPSRSWLNLRLSGLRLQLERDTAGVWHVVGFGAGGSKKVSLDGLSADLWITDLGLSVHDGRTGVTYDLHSPQAHIRKHGRDIRFAGDLLREGAHGSLHAVGVFADDGSYGRVYLAGTQLDLKGLVGDLNVDGFGVTSGTGAFGSWLDWRSGRVVRSVSKLDLADLAVHSATQSVVVPGVHGLLDIQRRADGDHLLWAGDDGGVLAVQQSAGSDSSDLRLSVRNLALAPLLPWAALVPGMSPAIGDWLSQGNPHGRILNATVRWTDDPALRSIDATVKGLGIAPSGSLPGVDHLDATIRGDADAFALNLPAQPVTLQLPAVFRQPLALGNLAADISVWHDDDAWHLGVEPLDFRGAGYGGQARGDIALPDAGGKPFLDMYVDLGGEVAAARSFWPRSMSEGTVQWLNRALVSGKIAHASALVRGSLADWPFRNQEGRFEGRAELDDLTLDYGTGWPAAEHLNAVASFIDNGMTVEATSGTAQGIKVDRAVAAIADFADSQLTVDANGNGTAAGLMDFVRNSPAGRNSADTLDKLKLGGDATFGFHLDLPLKKVEDFNLQGTAALIHSSITADAWKLKLDTLSGPIAFDGKGMHAGPLATSYRGQPGTLDVAVGGSTGDPAKIVTANLHGNFSFAELVSNDDNLKWIGDLGTGRAAFDVGVEVDRGDDGRAAPKLHVASTLAGVELNLPAPAKKLADDVLPLAITAGLPLEGAELNLALGNVVRARMRLPDGADKPLAATFSLGTTAPALLPTRGMRFNGHGDLFDVSGWTQYAVGSVGAGGQGPGLDGIDITADRAQLFHQDFGSMHIVARPTPAELVIDVDSANLAGNLRVPAAELTRRGITARLQRVYWPRDDDKPVKGKAGSATAPVGRADTTAAATPVDATPADASGLNPASLPPLHLWIGDLRLGDARLGEARLETWPTDKGMHIDQLRAQSKNVQIVAGGEWNGDARVSQTHLQIDFAAENLGRMLDALGFGGIVDGGKTQARLNATWPGGPSTLSLANMSGGLRVDVGKGKIPEAQSPGVGRLLGLVSLAELPRRLSFDFGDVLGKGLSFDSITGDFRLDDGIATTDNMQIKGPAAEITITGRTGLRSRDYDQHVLVVPHVGNSLPIVGAIAGGPVGAAAGFAVQGLLGKGLNKAASARYTVTGSWEKPVFTLVEKKNLPVAPVQVPTKPLAPAPGQ